MRVLERRFARWWIQLALVVSVAVAGLTAAVLPDARAQDAGKEDAVERARSLMEEGQQLFKQGRYKEAMEQFEAAYAAHAAGAFLYNAALAAERAGDRERAIYRYDMYLAADPKSPYADEVKGRIDTLKKELSAVEKPSGEGGGAEGPDAPDASPVPADEAAIRQMYSLVRVVSEPPGAPVVVYERTTAGAAPFRYGAANDGWRKVVGGMTTPKDLALKVGTYHVVVERFQDFNRSETDILLAPGNVYIFKANLSQGAFLGQLLLRTNVEHAKIYVDDPPPHASAPMFRGPGTVNLNTGPHELWVEAPGYQPVKKSFDIAQGQTTTIDVQLERLDYGYLVIRGNAGEIEVEIDEQPHPPYLSQGDPLRIKLPAGKHKLLLDADGRKAYEAEVEVPRGQELPIEANLVDAYPRGKAIVLGAFAIGAGIGGIFLHLEAEKPIGMPHDETEHQIFNVTRFVAWGASAVLAGLAIFYAIYDPNPDSFVRTDGPRELPEKERAASLRPVVTPWLGADAAGLSAGVAF